MSLSDLELSARSFMDRPDREYCHKALELKVFGQCRDITKSDKPEQHPWVAEFYRSRREDDTYCPYKVFSISRPYKVRVVDSFMLCRTKVRHNRNFKLTVCCSGRYDLTPEEFNYYEKRGYVRRL